MKKQPPAIIDLESFRKRRRARRDEIIAWATVIGPLLIAGVAVLWRAS